MFIMPSSRRSWETTLTISDSTGKTASMKSEIVRAVSFRAEGYGFDPRLRQTKVFKTGSSGFPPPPTHWPSRLWE